MFWAEKTKKLAYVTELTFLLVAHLCVAIRGTNFWSLQMMH